MTGLAVLIAIVAPAQAQDDVPITDVAIEADLHFKAGIAAYQEDDFPGALEHLLLSNRLVPNRVVMFNIARAWEKLGDFAQAYRYYADFLALESDPALRAAGERGRDRMVEKVALVAITSDPIGATVYVDRRNLGARGSTPQTLALSPGEHRILVERDGYTPAETVVTVAIGTTAAADLSLARILGSVHVEGTPGAVIHADAADGKVVGIVPADLRLAPGPHVLVIRAPGYEDQRVVVDVDAVKPAAVSVELELQTGQLVIHTLERGALIEIDGAAAGFTPAVLDVPAGEHRLRVSLAGFRPYEQPVDVVHAASLDVEVRLRSLQEVTAASRLTQAVEDAPASVSIVGREEIRAFGYQSVYDAVAGSRGIYPTDDLTYATLGVRGFSRLGDYGNRVLTTWDGHVLNDDQLGASYVGSDLTADLGDVQRIEVVRGPGSALYGTNAFFGVINVVTLDGADIDGVRVAVTADQRRTARAHASWGQRWGDAGAVLTIGSTLSQGLDYDFPEFEAPIENADASVSGAVHAKAWVGDLTVQAWHNGRQKRIPTGAFETIPGDPRARADDYRSFAEVRYEPELSDKTTLYARAYVDHYAYTGAFPYADPVGYLYSDRWEGVWIGAEPRIVTSPADALTLTVGAEARANVVASLRSRDNVDGDLLDEQPIQQAFAGYAVADLHLGDVFAATIGGRYDRFTLSDTGAFNPRAAIVLKPTDDDVVKLLYGTAFRAPSPYELFYNDDGLTQVKPDSLAPETVRTGEIEASHRFDEVTVLTGSVYGSEIQRLITLDDVDGVLVYGNTDDAVRAVGGEYELRRDWRRGTMLAIQHSIARVRVGDILGGEAIENSPTHSLSIKAAAPLAVGTTLASRFRVGSPRLTTAETQTPWSLLWDVTASGQLETVPVRWSIGVRNVLDWKEWHPGGADLALAQVPQPGRSLFLSLEAKK